MTAVPLATAPVYDHLARMTDTRGLFEHALLSAPRPEHGYCVDDVARALVVTCRDASAASVVRRLERCYLAFVVAAVEPDGSCHNRMDTTGAWTDTASTGDWWGRALWGLGVAASTAATAGMRARALTAFRVLAHRRSPDLRATAFSALGAAELLRRWPGEPAALDLLREAVTMLMRPAHAGWTWPEPRLTYANAVLAEALLLAGDAVDDDLATARGVELLAFLVDLQRRDEHLSVTPAAGRGPGESGPGFDQQPIEVAALADACASAFRVTGTTAWLDGIALCWNWFLGDNDNGTPMLDPVTGAGYDGLELTGRNANQGAESTLAMLSTAQHARQFRELL